MAWVQKFRPVASLLRRRRHVWANAERVHLEVRAHPTEAASIATLERKLARLDGARWARWHPVLQCIVVDRDPQLLPEESLVDALTQFEKTLGLAHRPFPTHETEHPGDPAPLARAGVEIAADMVGLGLGRVLRGLRWPRPALDVDLAALLSAAETVPALQALLRHRFGSATSDLALGVTNALNQALLQAWLGPLADSARRAFGLRSVTARRRAWAQWEPTLCKRPDRFPKARPPRPPPPEPEPRGPVENYTAKAVGASIAGFGLGLAATRSFESASAAVFGAVPKPALLGREAFSAHLGYRLAQRGALVWNPEALARLDRIHLVVVPGHLLARPEEALGSETSTEPSPASQSARGFVAAVRRAGLKLMVVGQDTDVPAWARPDGIVAPSACAETLQKTMTEGRGVLTCIDSTDPAASNGHVRIGLVAPATTQPPWGADVWFSGGIDDITFLVEAVHHARRASLQSVSIAAAELATSVLLATSGLRARTTRRIMTLANTASLVAVVNGVRVAQHIRGSDARPRPPLVPWHALDGEAVLERVGAHPMGLSENEATRRRPPPPAIEPPWRQFTAMMAEELNNPLAPVLAAGAGLSAMVGSFADAGLVASVVGLNALVGGVQRYHIEQALASLDSDERRPVRVRRPPRKTVWIDPEAVVVGDIVVLEAGEAVPADCRILRKKALEVDESSLTGESLPVAKGPEPCAAATVADRKSMLYAGTTVASGNVEAVVVAIGDDTETRRAAVLGEARHPRSGVETRLERLTNITAPAAALSGVVIAGLGLLRRRPTSEVIGAGVGLAVAAVPEGLPILATVAQLAAAGRLSRRSVWVRNPRAIEALGRVDLVCVDKTGTVTEGRIRLHRVSNGDSHTSVTAIHAHPHLRDVVTVALRASPSGRERLPHVTDRALVEGAASLDITSQGHNPSWKRVHELPFEPARGFHATLGRTETDHWISVKGAPEVLLPRCQSGPPKNSQPLDDEAQRQLRRAAEQLAAEGLRVLAVAEKKVPPCSRVNERDIEALEFRGFIAFADPVREEARTAVSALRRAGVATVMVTGDHAHTAAAIAHQLGLPGHKVLTGRDLDHLEDAALATKLPDIAVFARVTPRQKVRIVKQFQKLGRTVAMTGDGANDAPAIRLADVGIALGEGATASARHAADMVVTNERIETLVDAILEGRALWSSVRDAVSILVGGNLGEIAFTVLGSIVGGRAPLGARQLLLVNLLTDALPALAIALRPPTSTAPEVLLAEGPELSLGRALTRDVLSRAALTTGAALAAWLPARLMGTPARADTVALLTLIGTQLGQTLLLGPRSPVIWASSLGSAAAMLAVVQTPGVSHFFGCRPLGPLGLAQAAGMTALSTALAPGVPKLARSIESAIGEDRLRRFRESPWVQRLAEGHGLTEWLTNP